MTSFLLFYIYISFGAYKCMRGLLSSKKSRHILSFFIIALSSLLLISFILLYFWPFNARNVSSYKIHFIYNAILTIDFVFKIPASLSFLVGFIILKTYKKIIYSMGLIISMGCGFSVLYGSIAGKNELVLKKTDIVFNDLPSSFNDYKILQISDLHLGTFMSSKMLFLKAIDKTEKLNPDIFLFTGDLVNNFSEETQGWNESFKSLIGEKKCFSILGNHDYGNYTDWKDSNEKSMNFNRIINAHQNLGMRILNNQNVKIKLGQDSIYLVGVENWGHPPFPQYANLEKALSDIPANTFKILMSHDPAHWEDIISKRDDIALTLSGHTHGLQWGISYAGIRFSLAYLARKNWLGLYKTKNSYLYVNGGLGMVGIPWRINMPAEITLITLKRGEIN